MRVRVSVGEGFAEFRAFSHLRAVQADPLALVLLLLAVTLVIEQVVVAEDEEALLPLLLVLVACAEDVREALLGKEGAAELIVPCLVSHPTLMAPSLSCLRGRLTN